MKCTTPDIIDIIKRHDIFIFIETWLGSQDACPQIITGKRNKVLPKTVAMSRVIND